MGSVSGTDGGTIPGVNGLDPCPAVVLGAVENNISILVNSEFKNQALVALNEGLF